MASLKGSCHGHLVARFRFLIWKLSPLWSEEEGLGSAQGQSSGHAGARETVLKDRAVVTGVGTELATHRADRLEEPPGPLPLPTYWWNKFSSSSAAGWGSTVSCHLLPISTILPQGSPQLWSVWAGSSSCSPRETPGAHKPRLAGASLGLQLRLLPQVPAELGLDTEPGLDRAGVRYRDRIVHRVMRGCTAWQEQRMLGQHYGRH